MRFELYRYRNQGEMHWRVTQGHSLPHILDEETLQVLTLANWPSHFNLEEVIHGTNHKHFKSITERGLLAGGLNKNVHTNQRSHVHFCSPKMRGAGLVRSGYRSGSDMLVFIDFESALRGGIKFWISSNDVILTRGENERGTLPAKYIKKITDHAGVLKWCQPPPIKHILSLAS